jgi:hypothetical protein
MADHFKSTFVRAGGSADKPIYSDPQLEIAWLSIPDDSRTPGKFKRLGIRWRISATQEQGYPYQFGKPAWFELPDWLEETIVQACEQRRTRGVS